MIQKIFIIGIGLLFSLNAIGQGMKFEHGHLSEVLKKAKAENKIVFVDVYTTWCGPCKAMAKNVFTNSEVGTFFNKNFLNYKLDAENTKYQGPALAQKYKVNSFPSYLFLNGDGEVVFQPRGGSMTAEMFIKVGKKALGQKMNEGYDDLLSKYKKGNESDELLLEILLKTREQMALVSDEKKRDEFAQLYREVAGKYFTGSAQKFLNPEAFRLLKEEYYYQSIFRGHEIVEYIISHYDDFKAKIEEKELGEFLMFVNYSSVEKEAGKGNKEKYQQYLRDIKGCLKRAYAFNDESKIKAFPFVSTMGNAEYALGQKDYDTYLVEYEKYLSCLPDLGAIEYLMPARRMIDDGRGTPTVEQLKKCIPFNQIAYEKYKNAYVCIDFGILLAKVGEKEEAKKYIDEAYEIFRNEGERGQKMIERFQPKLKELGL